MHQWSWPSLLPEWASDVACIAGSDAEFSRLSSRTPMSRRDLRPGPALQVAVAPDQHDVDEDLGPPCSHSQSSADTQQQQVEDVSGELDGLLERALALGL